jgi:transposase
MGSKIPKGSGRRTTKPERAALAAKCKDQYEKEGKSIREIATGIERSYGFVHLLLSETGVTFRPRFGRPGPRKQK